MNNTRTFILFSLATLIGVAPCLASEPDTKQAIAMMGTQSAPMVVDDASVQKAIESLIKQQQNQDSDTKMKIPNNKLDNPVGDHPLRNTDKILILGGAELITM